MSYVNAPKSVIDASKRLDIKNRLLDLLCEEKKTIITIQCGLRALDLIVGMAEYVQPYDALVIATCVINLQRDFDCDPWEVVYNGKTIFNNK